MNVCTPKNTNRKKMNFTEVEKHSREIDADIKTTVNEGRKLNFNFPNSSDYSMN